MSNEARIGGFSKPSKMPCPGWSIPATACITGAKLRKIPGSVCSKCYAHKGFYTMPNVRRTLERRLKIYERAPLAWTLNMVKAIAPLPYFRWFDSGDLQSPAMLSAIVTIARNTPNTRHWLPTKEAQLVATWLRGNPEGFPPNLNVRISAPMLGHLPYPAKGPVTWSGVVRENASCPSAKQEGKCMACRLCWDKNIAVVTYKVH